MYKVRWLNRIVEKNGQKSTERILQYYNGYEWKDAIDVFQDENGRLVEDTEKWHTLCA